MAHASFELQAAVFGRLTADAALLTLLGGAAVHDRAPADAAFPYVTFGASNLQDWSTQTEDGLTHGIQIDVWSRERGRGEALRIAAAIEASLAGNPLSLASHATVNFALESTDVGLDEDGETYHAVLRYRAVTEPAA